MSQQWITLTFSISVMINAFFFFFKQGPWGPSPVDEKHAFNQWWQIPATGAGDGWCDQRCRTRRPGVRGLVPIKTEEKINGGGKKKTRAMKLAQKRRHSLDEGVLMHTQPWLRYCTILESVVHFHLPCVTRSPLYCCHESRGRCQHGVAWIEKIVLWALCWISLLCGQTVAWVVAVGIAFTLLFNGT